MKVLSLTVGALGVNCYIYYCEETKEAVIIDPGDFAEKILQMLRDAALQVKYIVNTHGHADHIGANQALKAATGAALLIHEADGAMLTEPKLNLSAFMGEPIVCDSADRFLKDGDTIAIGSGRLIVLHTPGHTKGGVCLLDANTLFSGDTLFDGSVGRCDFPGGSMKELTRSIKEKLMVLEDGVQVYPGHGDPTTIGRERRLNPYL